MKKILFISMLCFILLMRLPAYADDESMFLFTVQEGDKLINLCKELLEEPQKWAEIAEMNHLSNPHVISPGTTLKIPVRFLKGTPLKGEITFIKGDVNARFGKLKTWHPLQLGDSITQGTRIRTGKDGKAEITYKDGSSFFIWADTEIEVELASKKKDTHFVRDLFVFAGRAITKLKTAFGSQSHSRIHTRTAVIGVRGTEFRVSVDSEQAVRSEVLQGTIGVEAMQQEVICDKGEGTLVEKDVPPTEPKKLLPPPMLKNLKPLYTLPIQFEFETIEHAVLYRILIATDKDFKNVIIEKDIKPDEILLIPKTELGNEKTLEDGAYYLQVTSIDELGLEGIPSVPHLIHVGKNIVIPVPVLHTPEVHEGMMVAQWNDLGKVSYCFQMASDSAFENMMINKNTDRPEFLFERPEKSGVYYIRVNSMDADGNESEFSHPQSFNILQASGFPVLILADVSGSMQDKMKIPEKQGEKQNQKKVPKAEALKELLTELALEFPAETCDIGIHRVRYIAGDKKRYEPFLKIGAYDPQKMAEQIEDEFVTDYPVFNRRTPLADMLRQLDEKELDAMKGQVSLVLISDGRESFYDLDADEERSKKENIDPDDKIRGPLTEIRRMKEKYKNDFVLHTIFLDQKKKDLEGFENLQGLKDKETKGEILLKNMAAAGEGKYFSGVSLLEDRALLTEFCSMLCAKAGIEMGKEPMPVPEAVVIPPPAEIKPPLVRESEKPEGPTDSDGDGVYDSADQCPGTPKGAKVNKFGCWVLPGVLFDFDKWNIKPQYYPELDDAIAIIKQNPDLHIVIEGHTDGKGTPEYNIKLSERRANSVMEYFVKKGIEKKRLSTKGYGLTKPVATNATSEGRALNRRVELKPMK